MASWRDAPLVKPAAGSAWRAAPPVAPPIPEPSMGAAIPAPPSGEGVLMGTEDPAYGIMQMAGRIAGRPLDDEINLRERVYQKGRGADSGMDWARVAGNVGVTSPLGLLFPAGLSSSLMLGTALGAAQPTIGDPENYWQDKALQTGLGTLGGGLGYGATRATASAIKPLAGAAEKLFKEGVRPTLGASIGPRAKRFEDALTSVWGLGDIIKGAQGQTIKEFNRAAYNRALNPIGKSFKGDVGREGVSAVRTTLNKAYQDILPNLDLVPDQQLNDDIAMAISRATDDFLDDASVGKLQGILNKKLLDKLAKGPMKGETLKAAEHELARNARRFQGNVDADTQVIGDAIEESLTAVRAALARSNPQYASRLQDLNRGWANFTRIRDAASRQGAEEGIFTPGQLASAVRKQDTSIGKGQYAEGTALMQDLSDAGKTALAQKLPESGTTPRALGAMVALGGLGTVSPGAAAAGAAGALPYAPGMRQLMANAMLRRPQALEPIANAVRGAPPVSALSGGALINELGR